MAKKWHITGLAGDKRNQFNWNMLLLYHISHWVTGPTNFETPISVEESSTEMN